MTRRDRLVIVIVAVVAAIAASWLLLVSPKRDEAAKLGTKVASEQQELNTAQTQLAQNAAAGKQYASNYAALARLGEAVPASDDIPSLIIQLQNAADGARVNFQSLQNGNGSAAGSTPAPASGSASTAASAASPAQLSFTFSGSYFQLSNFFNKVQRFVTPNGNGVLVRGRLISLNSVNLTPAAGGFPQILAQITATIYTQSAPSAAAGAATGGSSAASSTQSTSGSSSSTPAPTAAISSPVR
ncbi:MAG TPA: type II secretion system protein GspM [Solirubrobacteraceae bacterium]|nr:type II secretion system protein GspM [Solirubrobacteraceae bacterium]